MKSPSEIQSTLIMKIIPTCRKIESYMDRCSGYRTVEYDRRRVLECLRDGDPALGRDLFRGLDNKEEAATAGIVGWPECGCTGCECTEPATCVDDCGNPTCSECQEYTTTDDGEILCSRCDGVEMVIESCGAGSQTRTYLRQTPPEVPDVDDEGEYALYWDTVGDGAHVVSRHSTLAEARQAVEAKDWPPPGDGTNYLCGYQVRHLVAGEWCQVEEVEE